MLTRLSFALNHRRDLWVTRLYYFAFMGGWGFVFPFVNLFYISLGLSGKQIGAFASVSAIIGLFSAPFWANRSRAPKARPRRLLQFALLMSALCYLLISLQEAFLPILFVVALQALTATSVSPLSETLAVAVARDARVGYGSIRLWGSLGWIFTVLTAGWLIERHGYPVAFWGAAATLTLAAALLRLNAQRHFYAQRPAEARAAPRLTDAVRTVTHDRPLLGFAIALGLITLLNSGVLQFENVYLSELGASKQLISVAGILSAIVELPFMLIADRIVARYGAHRLLLVTFFMTIFYRLAVLAFPSVWTIMLVRLIGGTSFSIYVVSFIGLVSGRTEPNERSTVFALYSITLVGLVNILANPLAGAFFDAFGAHWLYAFSASGYVLAIGILWWTRPARQG